MAELWYRYYDYRTAAPVDEYDEIYGASSAAIGLQKFGVTRHTPKGVWIDYHGNPRDEKFILTAANKRFACPTKEEALKSFLARKKRQLSILTNQADHVREIIIAIQELNQ